MEISIFFYRFVVESAHQLVKFLVAHENLAETHVQIAIILVANREYHQVVRNVNSGVSRQNWRPLKLEKMQAMFGLNQFSKL